MKRESGHAQMDVLQGIAGNNSKKERHNEQFNIDFHPFNSIEFVIHLKTKNCAVGNGIKRELLYTHSVCSLSRSASSSVKKKSHKAWSGKGLVFREPADVRQINLVNLQYLQQ